VTSPVVLIHWRSASPRTSLHASKPISYANRGARFIITYDQSYERFPSTLSTEQLPMFLRKTSVITNTANRTVQLPLPFYCQNIFTPTHQPQSCPMWRLRKINALVSTRPVIQLLSTCFQTRPWIQSTKPKPTFSTKRSTKLEWGDTRSITNKFHICDTFELRSVVSLQRSGFWLDCVRRFSNACVQFHAEDFFFALFSDSGAMACPSTHKVHDNSDTHARHSLATSLTLYWPNTTSNPHFFPFPWRSVFWLARASGDSRAIFGDEGVYYIPLVNIMSQLMLVT
jgi:hypothetical protein